MIQKFYICQHCGKIIAIVEDRTVPTICCNAPMKEIIPKTADASLEKHVPVYSIESNKVIVSVGSIEHPMTSEHYIQWISLQTSKGNQRKLLHPSDKPQAIFAICDDEQVEAVFAYCNLHSLWKN